MLPIAAHVVTEHSRTFQASSLVALAASSFFAGDMSMQLMVKGLVRRLGGFRLLWMGTFAWSFALLLVPLALAADSRVLLMLAQTAYGLFSGSAQPAAHGIIAETVGEAGKATVVSLVQAGAAAGTSLANFLMPLFVKRIGGKLPLIGIAVVGILTAAVLRASPPPPSTSVAPSASAPPLAQCHRDGAARDVVDVVSWLGDPLIFAACFAFYFSGFAYNGIFGPFLPVVFLERFGVQTAELSMLTSTAPIGNALACVLCGVASDALIRRCGWRADRVRALMQLIGTVVPAAALWLLARTRDVRVACVLVTCAMTAHGAQASGVLALLHDIGGGRAAELFAVANSIHKFAGMLAALVIRHVSHHSGWDAVLQITAAHYLICAAALLPLMGRTRQARARIFGAGAQARKQSKAR